MRIVVTGGAGFLGTLVIRSLLARMDDPARALATGADAPVTELVALDLAPTRVSDPRVRSVTGDLTDLAVLEEAITADTVGVFHLAAVLSGGSEADFDLAMAVNVDGTRALLDALRRCGAPRPPRMVFTSSLAVFGGEVPDSVPQTWATQPDSTYGAFKAVGELLVTEYGRKDFIDARVCRLPTISVRPGRPNSAASSFASGIIREPLGGEEAVCPVPHSTRMWLSSPGSAVANLVRAFELEPDVLPRWRVMNLPGLTVTVGEMLEALERVAGPAARALVRVEPDETIARIVTSWPGAFDVEDLEGLGFVADADFVEVVRSYRDSITSGA